MVRNEVPSLGKGSKQTIPYAVGYCSGNTVTAMWHSCLISLVYRDRPGIVHSLSGPALHEGRNKMAKFFVENLSTSKVLVVVDTDILFTPEDVDKLLAHDEPVVSGVYPTYHGESDVPNALDAEVIADGCGFMKIDRVVLEAMMPHPFDPVYVTSPNGEQCTTGEDVGFRIRAQRLGFDTVIDKSIQVRHLKLVPMVVPGEDLVNVDTLVREVKDRYSHFIVTPDPLLEGGD